MRRQAAPQRELNLSPEVLWYLDSRGYDVPTCIPKFQTPEPRDYPGARFCPEEVDKKILALRHLRHTKGKWAGKPIEPTAVQVAFIIAPIFGWLHEIEDEDTGEKKFVRIIREVYVEMPRKGAKTTLVAGLAMLLAFADGEGGAEVLLGAASRDQARQAFDPLKAIANSSAALKRAGVRALRSEIVQASTSSVCKVVSSRGDLSHGANVHGGLIDELHVHKNAGLLEAIESGTGAREQPLVFIITTADDGQVTSVYAQRRDLIEKLAKCVLIAPTMYGVIFSADDDDDPWAETTWRKANPLYPVTPSREFMQSAADKAKANPVQMASFLRLHLGIRSKLGAAYFDLPKWDANTTEQNLDSLKGFEAYGGLDLASVSDITALVWAVIDPGREGYDVLARFWLPEAALLNLDQNTANTGSLWVKNGWITLTPGDVTDYDFIEKQILEDAEFFEVVGLGYDRWNSSQLVINLQNEGLPLEKVGQGYASLSGPLKEMDRLVRRGTAENPLFRHGGNPVLRWMADNMRPAVDAAANVKPDKSKSMHKIDGISASVMALSVAMSMEKPISSAYETGKVETL